MNHSASVVPPAGKGSSTSPPQQQVRLKKKAPVNPLISNRRPQKPKTLPPRPPTISAPTNQSNLRRVAPNSTYAARLATSRVEFTQRPRSPTPETTPTTYEVYTTPRSLLEGLRNHVARLQSKTDVDVTDENVFTRPVKLHRRDPNAKPTQLAGPDADGDGDVEMRTESDDKEKDRNEMIRAERQRIREETAKMIAPSATKKKSTFRKKNLEFNRGIETVEDEKRRTLRYEEALPWHLEDFDNKHTWVGTYEATLSDSHIMFIMDQDTCRVIPVEKWYRFREKGHFKHLSADQVEAMLSKRIKEPRWLMQHKERDERAKQAKKASEKGAMLFKRKGEQDDVKDELYGLGTGGGEGDQDDIDFNADDLFDDDDDNNPFEEDEDEQKEAKQRIKKEQLNANVFDMADEKEVEEEEERQRKLAQLQRELEKGTRKTLVRQEHNFVYDESDEDNPYTSEVSWSAPEDWYILTYTRARKSLTLRWEKRRKMANLVNSSK
jgi:transcription initiation factor TFIIF subunit alpha